MADNRGFWSDANTAPKRQHRFLMSLGGISSWFIKATSKPSFSISKTEHKYLNHTFKYPGVVTWEPIKVTLVDPGTPDAAGTLENILLDSGYNFPTVSDRSTISKKKAVGALGRVTIEQLGPEGETIEQWKFHNAWILDVNYGEVSYESSEMVEISLTIDYDWADLISSKDGALESAIR